MKDFAKAFYQSRAWKQTRDAYMSYRHGLCERCNGSAEIVHHRKHLTANNIKDVNITLAWSNLECICRTCHAQEHEGVSATIDGLVFDGLGNIVQGNRGKHAPIDED